MENNKPSIKICLFNSLNDAQIKTIDSICEDVSLKPGEYLLREGDQPSDIFFVTEGQLEVMKYDSKRDRIHTIGSLSAGSIVGELALFENALRSASVKALTTVRLKKLSIASLEELKEADPNLYLSLHKVLTKNLSAKLRQTDLTAADALQQKLEEYENRVHTAKFLLYSIVGLSFVIYSMRFINELYQKTTNSTLISIPIILIMLSLAILFIKASNLPNSYYGITTKNWKKSTTESILLSFLLCSLFVIFKFIVISYFPAYEGKPLFEPFALFNTQETHNLKYWLFFTSLYVLFVPLQELIVRGIFQGFLDRIIMGKNRALSSIVMSNLLFSTPHVFISEWLAVISFTGGLAFGWLYYRNRTLIGPIIAHSVVGIWSLNIVGI